MKYFKLPALAAVLALVSIAPAQVTRWTSVGIGGGGALYSPSFNPVNPNEIYVGCDMSGLYHSVNAGVSWDVLPFTSIEGGHFANVQFTNDANIRYAVNYRNDAMTPVRSNDAGRTWTTLPGDPTYGGTWQLAVDPNRTDRVLLTDYRYLYVSTDGGNTFAMKYHNPSLGGGYIAGSLFKGDSIYLGTNLGVLSSFNGGDTFVLTPYTGIPANQGLLSFAGAVQNDTIRFTGVAADTNDIYVGVFGSDYWGICKGIYTFDLGQPSWTLNETGVRMDTDFPFFTVMARNNIHTAWLGGGSSAGDPTMFKTTDGGRHWTETFHCPSNQNIYTGWSGAGGDRGWSYGECAMGFGVAPLNPDIAAFSDYGFVHVTYDGGDTWRQCYVSPQTENLPGHNITTGSYYQGVGLENTSCWDILWLNPDSLFVGFADINGIRSTDAGNTWAFIPNLTLNSVYLLAEHPVTHVLYAAIASVHDLYQSTRLVDSRIDAGNGNVWFSTDRGASWSTLHNFGKPVIWVALDPNRPHRMYAAVVNYTNHLGGIWRTDDLQDGASSVWVQCPAPTRTQGHPFNIRVLNDGSVVTSWSGRIDSTGHFTASSGVFVSTDSGATWLDRSAAGLDYWTMDVVIDPHDTLQNTWYAGVFSGWGGPPNGLGGLYRTTNRGTAWTRINALDRVGSCAISPANPDEMYLTTEVNGLWYTSNLSAPTPSFSFVASYPFCHPARVFYSPFDTDRLWVTSFGSGLRIGDNYSGIAAPVSRTPEPCLRFSSPCLASHGVRFSINLNSSDPASLAIFDAAGREVRTFRLSHAMTPSSRSLRWDCRDNSGHSVTPGVYLCNVTSGGRRTERKLVLMP